MLNDTTSTPRVQASDFFPSLLVPATSFVPLIKAIALLCVAVYSLTIKHRAMVWLRVFLAGPAMAYFWGHSFGPYRSPERQVDVGMVLTGLYGIMGVFECTAIGIVREDAPRWVEIDGKALPYPTTVLGRMAYVIDYMSTVRGTSMFKGIRWDFAPRAITHHPALARREFIIDGVKRLIQIYIAYDFFDTLNKSYPWNTRQLYPVTNIPSIPLQLLFSFSVCICTALSILAAYVPLSLIYVSLGSPPASWPPMFNSPFSATSLADLWTRRWHLIFRRNFDAMNSIILSILPPIKSLLVQRVIRIVLTFILSTLFHLFIMYRPVIDEYHPHPHFLDISTIAFFMIQPFGLIFEALVLTPLAQHLPPHIRDLVIRLWGWGFLLWTGRWWADVWVRRGLWDHTEKVVGISITRGIWYGKWIVV